MRHFAADFIFTGEKILSQATVSLTPEGVVSGITEEVLPEAEFFDGLLSPGFINCHGHLELAGLRGAVKRHTGLHGFIPELQSKRGEATDTLAIEGAEAEMYTTGTVAALDISNGAGTVEVKKASRIRWHTFVELFGFDPENAAACFEKGESVRQQFREAGLSCSITPHAPYSVSAPLARLIFSSDAPFFSIHNQETGSEKDFLLKGHGPLADLLKSFGMDAGKASWKGKVNPDLVSEACGDKRIVLMVHNTFTSAEDLERTIGRRDPFVWCMCPGANLFIENTLPAIPMFYRKGVPVVFGTDSLASNTGLDLFSEAAIALKAFPELSPEQVLRSLTSVPASVFSLKGFGSLSPGKRPGLVHVRFSSGDSLQALRFATTVRIA